MPGTREWVGAQQDREPGLGQWADQESNKIKSLKTVAGTRKTEIKNINIEHKGAERI